MGGCTLDLLGLKCPLPVLKTKQALRKLKPDDLLEVLTSDPVSAIDIPNLVREEGDLIEQQLFAKGRFSFLIRRNGRTEAEYPPARENALAPQL